MKKILITGGAGFIGSHLCEALLAKGYEVYALDNLSSGCLTNLKSCLDSPYFHFIEYDLCEGCYWENESFEWICHLASPASPKAFSTIPLSILRVNLQGSVHVLDLARKTGAKVLLASTSEVYGDPLVHPQIENYWGNVNSYGPRSCYDEGKRAAEALCYAYRQEYGVDVQVIRIFNTYGPRMQVDDGRIVPNLLSQALEQKPLTIYGDGSQTRCFMYVSDLIEAIMKIINSGLCTEPINLGNPMEISVLELAKILSKLMQIPLLLEYCPLPIDDPRKRQPDITFARNRLSWEPQVSLEVGLGLTISALTFDKNGTPY